MQVGVTCTGLPFIDESKINYLLGNNNIYIALQN
jgi:hypothetical protein